MVATLKCTCMVVCVTGEILGNVKSAQFLGWGGSVEWFRYASNSKPHMLSLGLAEK